MNAILFLDGDGARPMAQVLDRPLIQHVIEQLVERGIRCITLLHGPQHNSVVRHLGEGRRWGITIEPKIVTQPPAKAEFQLAAEQSESEMILCGNAVRLAHLPLSLGELAPWNTLFFDEEDGVGAWSGWALLRKESVADFAAAAARGLVWRDALRYADVQARKVFLDHPSLSAASPKDILLANRRALDGRFPGLFFNGRQREPGVWMARGAKIASSVVLRAPCYVGEDSWIGANCTIGPYAVIAPGCVIESRTSITSSVIGEQTFLGPELEVADSSVMHNRIHNVRLGVELVVPEAHIASALN